MLADGSRLQGPSHTAPNRRPIAGIALGMAGRLAGLERRPPISKGLTGSREFGVSEAVTGRPVQLVRYCSARPCNCHLEGYASKDVGRLLELAPSTSKPEKKGGKAAASAVIERSMSSSASVTRSRTSLSWTPSLGGPQTG